MSITKLSAGALALIFLSVSSIAQSSDPYPAGIKWANYLTWEQIQQKALQDNKYIFVDCYSTWCGPCKWMDQKVYPNDTVGDFLNSNFISVRVQLDTTKRDNEEIKSWYKTAATLSKKYSIVAMPTFLFFSPQGELLHKAIGSLNVAQFVYLAKEALDSSKQYYPLLKKYRSGIFTYKDMPELARTSKRLNDDNTAYDIAARYIHGYLDQLTEDSFISKGNLKFILDFRNILNSGDRVFSFCLNKPQKIDVATYRGASQRLADYIITKEEVQPIVEAAKSENAIPNWQNIYSNINSKYGAEYAYRDVLYAKPGFYKHKKDWNNYTNFLIELVQQVDMKKVSGPTGANYLNDQAWEIFLHTDKNKELEKALSWCDLSLKLMGSKDSVSIAGIMDTKANLLYKLGRTKEALILERKATSMDSKNKDIQEAFFKMKEGKATWTGWENYDL